MSKSINNNNYVVTDDTKTIDFVISKATYDMSGVVISQKAQSKKIDITRYTTNYLLDVSYKQTTDISNVSCKTLVQVHANANADLENSKFGVIYLKNSDKEFVIEDKYNSETLDEFVKSINATFVEIKASSETKETLLRASLDFEFSEQYSAVIVSVVDGKVLFSQQANICNKDMVKYYLDNNLITNEKEVAALQQLK